MDEPFPVNQTKQCLAAKRLLTALSASVDPDRPYLVQLAEWAVANVPAHESRRPALQEHLDTLNGMKPSDACQWLTCRGIVNEFESGSEPLHSAKAVLLSLLEILTPSEMEALRATAKTRSVYFKKQFADLGPDTKL